MGYVSLLTLSFILEWMLYVYVIFFLFYEGGFDYHLSEIFHSQISGKNDKKC